MSHPNEIRFRNGEEVLTLVLHKPYDPDTHEGYWVVGWCPEKDTTFGVPPENVILEPEPTEISQ